MLEPWRAADRRLRAEGADESRQYEGTGDRAELADIVDHTEDGEGAGDDEIGEDLGAPQFLKWGAMMPMKPTSSGAIAVRAPKAAITVKAVSKRGFMVCIEHEPWELIGVIALGQLKR
jgi:hypothetical protein